MSFNIFPSKLVFTTLDESLLSLLYALALVHYVYLHLFSSIAFVKT